MKNLLLTLLMTATLTAYALPPQAEADMLMIQAKAAMDAKNYAEAVKKFSHVQELNVPLPPTFSYHYGNALANAGEFEQAKQQLEQYITKEGSGGKFYKEALDIYSTLESRQIEVKRKTDEAEERKVATSKAREQYLRDMRRYRSDLDDYNKDVQKCERAKKDAEDWAKQTVDYRCGNGKCSAREIKEWEKELRDQYVGQAKRGSYCSVVGDRPIEPRIPDGLTKDDVRDGAGD